MCLSFKINTTKIYFHFKINTIKTKKQLYLSKST